MKRVFPVIHAQDEEQVLRNTEIARDTGCDGVFVINHGFPAHELMPLANAAKKVIHWVGVNMLGVSAKDAMLAVPDDIDGLWTDNANIDERQGVRQPYGSEVRATQIKRWSGEYFGGVAFKYQREVESYHRAAMCAAGYMEVVTTSGRGTGYAADLDKIQEMHRALQGLDIVRLGVASGITPDNVEEYIPYVDDFLVATGISTDFHNLDLSKTRELVKKVKNG